MISIEKYKSGEKQSQGSYYAFNPTKINDQWQWKDSDIDYLLSTANYELGGLNSYSELIPNIDLYIEMHIVAEANKSNLIEGTRTTIEEDLLSIEDINPEKRDDYEEVQNYIHALNFGVKEVTVGNLPISTRLIKGIHKILLTGVRGNHKLPGEFRNSQNWVGGGMPSNAKYVPPIHQNIGELMSDLENFIHNDKIKVPELIKIAIIHYQFETIHPFLDGNGRVGRLIIPLYLLNKKLLDKPCFYISDFFEKNRMEYYDFLDKARTKNDISNWIKFFLNGVIATSKDAKNKFKKIVELVKEYESKISMIKGKHENVHTILNLFYKRPYFKSSEIEYSTNLSKVTINSILKSMQEQNILIEITGKTRNKIFILHQYLNIFIQ